MTPHLPPVVADELVQFIKDQANSLGFAQCAITDTELGEHEAHLLNWLRDGFHGEMHYMEKHGTKRSRPKDLVEGTLSIISVRLDYYPPTATDAISVLNNPQDAYISRYALGRDYHKVIRKKLKTLAMRVGDRIGPFGYRVFVDSAPILEKAIAEKAGLGWIGKHSNLLSTAAGSWFFLGEIYTDLALPKDNPEKKSHCGSCTACIDACPTQAIVAPYRVDARKCISYHTIELKGAIPLKFRKAMGNRIYGCDDCQLVCPFNKFKNDTTENDFAVRHGLDHASLVSLFYWTEEEFKQKMAGSAIYRIGYQRWLRNIAVALGNAPTSEPVISALQHQLSSSTELVSEHIRWALSEHGVTF